MPQPPHTCQKQIRTNKRFLASHEIVVIYSNEHNVLYQPESDGHNFKLSIHPL
jgi:hypothetical protein